jgi:hypothetical protein
MANPDPHGLTALLLCESLLHVLVEHGVLSQEKATEAIKTVIELTREMANSDEQSTNGRTALNLIERIDESFSAIGKR